MGVEDKAAQLDVKAPYKVNTVAATLIPVKPRVQFHGWSQVTV